MSHFAVLVVGDDVEGQLQRYHEFECTGQDDQYVKEIDETEEARKTFEKNTTRRYRDPEGNLHSPYTPEGSHSPLFWRELTPEEETKYGKRISSSEGDDGLRLESTDWHDGRGYRTKAFAWPSDGWSEVEVPTSTVQTFAEFCADYYGHEAIPFGTEPDLAEKHKYGYTIVDEQDNVIRTINRTNPDRKWDGYTVGGRWNGFSLKKPLAVGVLGEPGLQVMNSNYEPVAENRADVIMKGDIDVEGMRDEAGEKAAERYDIFERVTAGLPQALSWKQVQENNRTGKMDEEYPGEPEVDWKTAREDYNSQPMVKALRADKETIWYELDEFLYTREEYIQQHRDRALVLFAVVKDGVWYERGRMGWWGMVSDEKDRDEWNRQFSALIDGLPDNTLLSVVDCHI